MQRQINDTERQNNNNNDNETDYNKMFRPFEAHVSLFPSLKINFQFPKKLPQQRSHRFFRRSCRLLAFTLENCADVADLQSVGLDKHTISSSSPLSWRDFVNYFFCSILYSSGILVQAYNAAATVLIELCHVLPYKL